MNKIPKNYNLRTILLVTFLFIVLPVFENDISAATAYINSYDLTISDIFHQYQPKRELQPYVVTKSIKQKTKCKSFQLDNTLSSPKKNLLSINISHAVKLESQNCQNSSPHPILSILHRKNIYHQASEDESFLANA